MAAQLHAAPCDYWATARCTCTQAGSPTGEPAACTGRLSMADGFQLALQLVADPYSAAAYDSPSLLRAGAALRTMYGGERTEPRHHAAMRRAENAAAEVVRIRLAAEAAAPAATLPAATSGAGPAPRIRPIAPAPTGAPGAPAVADAWAAELERKREADRLYSAAVAALPRAWGAGSPDDF